MCVLFVVQKIVHNIMSEGRPILCFYQARKTSPKGVLSNFYVEDVVYEGVTYRSGEHALHAAKAIAMGDLDTLEEIRMSSSPRAAKKWGRLVRGYDDVLWKSMRFDVQCKICTAKLGCHPELLKWKDYCIVEASPTDTVWGVGVSLRDAQDPTNWRGENLLGKAWMKALAMA